MPGTTKAKKVAALAAVPLFEGLSKRDLGVLADLLHEAAIAPGELLIEEGAEHHELVIVLDGEVAVSRRGWHLGRSGPGTVVGELSLLDGGPVDATVAARTDTLALILDERDFRAALGDRPAVAHKVMRRLARRLRDELSRTPARG